MSKRTIIITTTALLLIGCCILSAIIGALSPGDSTTASDTQTTTTSAYVIGTVAPTATPIPPTPTMTAQQRTQAQIVALIKPYGQQLRATDAKGDITIYDLWVNGVANNQLGLAFAKIEIFHIEEAIWTQWHGTFNEVDVIIQGPPIDGFDGTPTPYNLAVAMLFASTEAHFDWPHLVPETAWEQYDTAFSILSQ